MRLFTAIDLPHPILDSVEAFVAPLRPLAPIRWSPPSNMHVTTKFIGEWPAERLPELIKALKSVTAPAFNLSLGGLGWFPSARSPHVLWMGVQGGDALNNLAARTEDAIACSGCPKEQRTFSPHLTLARINRGTDLCTLRRALDSLASPVFQAFPLTDFHLYQSEAGRYRKLQTFCLVRSSE